MSGKKRKTGIKYEKCLKNKCKLLKEYLDKKKTDNVNVNDKPDNKAN